MRRIWTLVFGGVLVLAAVGAGAAPSSTVIGGEETPRPDPDEDTIGWEDGVWHNESIAVDQSDGLSERELELLVARGMARVEVIRNREFIHPVPVEVVSRADFRGFIRFASQPTPTARAWENQRWEAMFVVNESTDAVRESITVTTERVAGLYYPLTGQIFVIAEPGGPPTIDEATLVHELTHALQDQTQGFEAFLTAGGSADRQLAAAGLTEGEANYVMARYEERCATGEWECLDSPGGQPTAAPYLDGPLPDYNLGMQVLGVQPYSDGPAYVADLYERGGWEAVDAAYDDRPVSTEQVIHPERREEPPESMDFTPNPRNNWSVVAPPGTQGYQTVGEAGIFTMFYYQGRANDNAVIDWREFGQPDQGQYDRFNYTSEPSAGWANDRLYVYAKDDRRGYVWATKWDTRADAREFAAAYREVLAGHGATRGDDRIWTISDGGFADAFRIDRDSRTVTIVNGPNVSAVPDIHPDRTNTSQEEISGPTSIAWGVSIPHLYNGRHLTLRT